MLKKVRFCLPMKQRILFYSTKIRSVLYYISTIWTSCHTKNLGRFLKLQERAARVISDVDDQGPFHIKNSKQTKYNFQSTTFFLQKKSSGITGSNIDGSGWEKQDVSFISMAELITTKFNLLCSQPVGAVQNWVLYPGNIQDVCIP